ncbi:MAG: STAS domain-containing protein [Actinomycetota bacterium]
MTRKESDLSIDNPVTDRTIIDHGLVIRTITTGYSVRLLLVGELNSSSAPTLERCIRDHESEGCAKQILDLGGLSFIDSTGLRALVRVAKSAGESGWSLRVVNARGSVGKVLKVTDMESVFSYWQNPKNASSRTPPSPI